MASKTDDLKEKVVGSSPFPHPTPSETDSLRNIGTAQNVDTLHRSLNNRQVQWIAMGGSIGTALFVSIGLGLMHGGPASLLLGFVFYSGVISAINSSIAEMAVYMPIPGSFIRYAGKWVDEAFGFVAGWNLFFYEAILVPFEISALSLVLTFWRDDIPAWAVCVACIALYTAINVGAVHVFGEAEFRLSSGKVLLVFLLFGFTLVTMVGGNPQGDAYGFRYWNNPGAFAEHITTGSLGRFEGFLGAVFAAAFTVCGPEYISMVAGEAIYPRVTIKMAFKTVYLHFGCFFVLGALCVGIVVPYDDPTLANVLGIQGGSTGAASPYVIAMQNLGVEGLPHVVNALLVTSIFSAGNTYFYMATRSLHGLAVDGQAPAFLAKTTRSGAPLWCLVATAAFSLLSLMQLGAGAAQALQWLVNLVTASQQLNYVVIGTTYLFFYRALNAQGLDRRALPYRGWCQPYVNCFGLAFVVVAVFLQGYTVFLPGNWNLGNFFTYYTMVSVCAILFVGWKVLKRTKLVRPEDADLVWDKPAIDAYEASIDPPPGLWTEMVVSFLSVLRIRRNKTEKETEV